MKCPLDGTELRMTDRQGVEVDYCPQCRGVWLDRGELDKLLEASRRYSPSDDYQDEPRRDHDRDRDRDRDSDRDRDDRRGGHYPHKRKESFWERIFDFD